MACRTFEGALRILLATILVGCGVSDVGNERTFRSTRFRNDTVEFKLVEVASSPLHDGFLALLYDENSSMSGNKILKLYSTDSNSVAELHYAAHPMELVSWNDTLITFAASVFSAHGDLKYRRWYLDNSVDGKRVLGRYRIAYEKEYDMMQE